jgi:adenosine deaminase
MLSVGARITLNTDDPVQFGIRYDDEFNIMEREGILLVDELLKIKANAIEDTDHIHNCQNY